MKAAALMLFLFGAIVGAATFIENDYGTQTAKALIYNAQWFEFFLLYFILLLVYNIIKYKSYKSKPSVFLFHIAFLVIAIGAMITRYIGYEGVMHIREGSNSSHIISVDKFIKVHVEGEGEVFDLEEKNVLLSSMSKNDFEKSWDIKGKEVSVELINYLPAAELELVKDEVNGKEVLELMIASGGKGTPLYLEKGESHDAGKFLLTFDAPMKDTSKPVLNLFSKTDGTFEMQSDFGLKTLSMLTQEEAELQQGTNPFITKKLYQFGHNSVVFKAHHTQSRLQYVSNSLKVEGAKPELLTFKVKVNDKESTLNLFSYRGNIAKIESVELDGVKVSMYYGVKRIQLPFSLKLIDFKLERYPGSNSPSSYASDVELTDLEKGIKELPYEIYMNHVLDHRSYRFFQSSYDQDERGTVLSVNHDPGTLPTYLGYLLLTLGMLWNLFDRNGRFQKLLKGARKLQNTSAAILLMAFFAYTPTVEAAPLPPLSDEQMKMVQAYPDETLNEFGRLVIQDTRGRMKPLDTMAREVVAKLSGKSTIYGVEPTSIMLGMTVDPKQYQAIPMIKVDHTRIAKELGLAEGAKYANFFDFFTKEGEYKLTKQINESIRKQPLDKNLYDKELVNVDERLNVAYLVYTGTLLQIYPKPKDDNNKWLNPQDAMTELPQELSEMVRMMTMYLFQGAETIQESGDTEKFSKAITLINMYQNKFGSEVMLSKRAIDVELKYNEIGLFSKLVPVYLLVGLILLIAAFVNVVKPNRSIKWFATVAWGIMVLAFLGHVANMGMRWYVGGYAPWSNAYESIVFIAASTVFAGLIFAKRSPFALGATALLAGVTMGVAHLSFINPEITTLVPVLKSYWLMIHVATIISGDGFLGLGSMVSLVVLLLYIIKRGENENIDRSIKELTNIAEMSLIVGLFLMTIGNFLGGVWANESWGRYWGWDAKETWAAVTILIYAMVLHLRFIPIFKNTYAFNVASLWAYSTVIMTYFGVNYYLSGLHSYAAGAPMPLPDWVIPAVGVLFVLTLLAAKSWKNIKLALMILSPLILWVVGLIWMLKY
jgi:cytochrome c-type biogenesis protein CcsB